LTAPTGRSQRTHSFFKRGTSSALNSHAIDKMVKIAKDVLKEDINLNEHPHFDNNHYCCWNDTGSSNEKKFELDKFETANSVVDEHNTATRTIDEIRKEMLTQRTKYESIIDREAQQ
jgi:hypothetical protein